jgi:hypothetical protein
MSTINGVDMPNFTPDEYRHDELKYMSKSILHATQKFRTAVKAKVIPSKKKGAQARFTGSKFSEHFVSGNPKKTAIWKYSTATDVFVNCRIFKAWSIAVNTPYISRVGVYFDTKNNNGDKQPMLHLGLKEDGLLWFRVAGKYVYSTHKDFHDELFKLFNQYRTRRI